MRPYVSDDYGSLDSGQLRQARKNAASAVEWAEAELKAARADREALDLEHFRRLHEPEILALVDRIKADPVLLEAAACLRRDEHNVRRWGIMSHAARQSLAGGMWAVITGTTDRHGSYYRQTAAQAKKVEVVLGLLLDQKDGEA